MTRTASPIAVLLAGAAALALTTGAAHAFPFGKKKEAPVAEAPPPPPAPVATGPALAGRVIEAAGAYRAYMRKAAAIQAGFTDGQSVETALEAAEAADPISLNQGVIAYAAVLALQDDAFTTAVRNFGKDPEQKRVIAERIAADPAYATVLPGAGSAAALVIRALDADGAKVLTAGKAVKQSAYDVQRKAWSKESIPDRPGRLARAKTISAAQMSTTPADVAELAAASTPQSGARLIETSNPGASAGPPYTPVVARGLAIAALAALGMGGDDNGAAVQSLLNESSGQFCHSMAKLNLYQCLAVAKPYYEDVFCLGQHILMDTGQCVSKSVGAGKGGSAQLTAAAAGRTAAAATATGMVGGR